MTQCGGSKAAGGGNERGVEESATGSTRSSAIYSAGLNDFTAHDGGENKEYLPSRSLVTSPF